MPIRKQNLEEWFIGYQLLKMQSIYHHLPVLVQVDLTPVLKEWSVSVQDLPITAIVIRAAGILAKRFPEANQSLIRSPWGHRVIQFDGGHVNVPLYMNFDGRRILSAIVLRDADQKSVKEIVDLLNEAKKRPLSRLPIARRLLYRSNNLFSRCELKILYFFAQRIPQLNYKFAGGISVSSLVRRRDAGDGISTFVPHGPTVFTISPGQVELDPRGRSILHLGIGFEHCTLSGYAACRLIDAFCKILTEEAGFPPIKR